MARKNGTITKTFTFQGKRYYITGKSEKEVYKKMALKQQDLESGENAVNSNMLVRKWADKAVSAYKTNQSEITREKFIQRMNHCVLEHLGDMPLKMVTPMHCQDVMNLQIGKSKTQINAVYQILRFIFARAKDNNLISTNPAQNIQKPKGCTKNRRSITDQERYHLLKVCEKDSRFNLFLLMLYCGCRPSEARECKGMDIQEVGGEKVLHIRGTKTASADRYVPLPMVLYEKIKDTPKFQYISLTSYSKKHCTATYQRLTKGLYRALNISMGCKLYRNQLIPPLPLNMDFVPYCLRHTYCTDLQKIGIDIRTAQYLMGHADISMTANIYTHADTSTILSAAKIMKGTTLGTTLKGI